MVRKQYQHVVHLSARRTISQVPSTPRPKAGLAWRSGPMTEQEAFTLADWPSSKASWRTFLSLQILIQKVTKTEHPALLDFSREFERALRKRKLIPGRNSEVGPEDS